LNRQGAKDAKEFNFLKRGEENYVRLGRSLAV